MTWKPRLVFFHYWHMVTPEGSTRRLPWQMTICGAQLKSLEQESHTHGNDDQLSRVGSIGRDKTIDDDDNAEPIHWHVVTPEGSTSRLPL